MYRTVTRRFVPQVHSELLYNPSRIDSGFTVKLGNAERLHHYLDERRCSLNHLVLEAVYVFPSFEHHRAPLLGDELLVGRCKLVPFRHDLLHILKPQRGKFERPGALFSEEVKLGIIYHCESARDPIRVRVWVPDVSL